VGVCVWVYVFVGVCVCVSSHTVLSISRNNCSFLLHVLCTKCILIFLT